MGQEHCRQRDRSAYEGVQWRWYPVLHSFCPPLPCMCAKSLQFVQLFMTPWPVTHETPLSMGFSWQVYLSGLLCPPSGDLPDPRIELTSLISPALTGGFFTTSATWEAHISPTLFQNVLHKISHMTLNNLVKTIVTILRIIKLKYRKVCNLPMDKQIAKAKLGFTTL